MGIGRELDDSQRNERSEGQDWIGYCQERGALPLWHISVVFVQERGEEIGARISWVRKKDSLPRGKGSFAASVWPCVCPRRKPVLCILSDCQWGDFHFAPFPFIVFSLLFLYTHILGKSALFLRYEMQICFHGLMLVFQLCLK